MSKSKSRRISRAVSKGLIEQLAQGERTPAELASDYEVPLHRLAHWATDPANARVLAGLSYLADVRAQMLLSRYRANAAIQLITIATNKDPSELSRKACVDLLRTDLKVFTREVDEAEIEEAVDERTIARALEELGREHDDD